MKSLRPTPSQSMPMLVSFGGCVPGAPRRSSWGYLRFWRRFAAVGGASLPFSDIAHTRPPRPTHRDRVPIHCRRYLEAPTTSTTPGAYRYLCALVRYPDIHARARQKPPHKGIPLRLESPPPMSSMSPPSSARSTFLVPANWELNPPSRPPPARCKPFTLGAAGTSLRPSFPPPIPSHPQGQGHSWRPPADGAEEGASQQ